MIIAKQKDLDFIASVVANKSKYWCNMIEEVYDNLEFIDGSFIVLDISDPDESKRIWFLRLYTIGFEHKELYKFQLIAQRYFRPRVVIFERNKTYTIQVSVQNGGNVFFKNRVKQTIYDVWTEKNNITRNILTKEYIYQIL